MEDYTNNEALELVTKLTARLNILEEKQQLARKKDPPALTRLFYATVVLGIIASFIALMLIAFFAYKSSVNLSFLSETILMKPVK